MRYLLALTIALLTGCRPNVIITIQPVQEAIDDGLKGKPKFELNLFLYAEATDGLTQTTETVRLDKRTRFRLDPGSLDLFAEALKGSPDSCDEDEMGCTGGWVGSVENLIVPPEGHIDEIVPVMGVCDCPVFE